MAISIQDTGTINSTPVASITTTNPTLLNSTYTGTIKDRAAIIHDAARRFVFDSVRVISQHAGIFESSDTTDDVLGSFLLGEGTLGVGSTAVDHMNFIVVDAANVPRAVGTAISDWETSTISVSLTHNIAAYANVLQTYGFSFETMRG